jgi:hypothetical protein
MEGKKFLPEREIDEYLISEKSFLSAKEVFIEL